MDNEKGEPVGHAAFLPSVLFSAYGVAIGAGYIAVLHMIVPEDRWVIFFWGLVIPAFFGLFGWGFANNSEMSNLQRLLVIPLLPIGLLGGTIGMAALLMFAAVVLPVALVGTVIHNRRFRTLMRSQGRYLDVAELRQKLESGKGTLIEEMGHKGPYRVWWTGDMILDKGTPPSTDEDFFAILTGRDHPFNTQCLKEYLDPTTGKAFLTGLTPRNMKSNSFKRMYPRMVVVMVVTPFRAKNE
jgi:hypothetical protein